MQKEESVSHMRPGREPHTSAEDAAADRIRQLVAVNHVRTCKSGKLPRIDTADWIARLLRNAPGYSQLCPFVPQDPLRNRVP